VIVDGVVIDFSCEASLKAPDGQLYLAFQEARWIVRCCFPDGVVKLRALRRGSSIAQPDLPNDPDAIWMLIGDVKEQEELIHVEGSRRKRRRGRS